MDYGSEVLFLGRISPNQAKALGVGGDGGDDGGDGEEEGEGENENDVMDPQDGPREEGDEVVVGVLGGGAEVEVDTRKEDAFRNGVLSLCDSPLHQTLCVQTP